MIDLATNSPKNVIVNFDPILSHQVQTWSTHITQRHPNITVNSSEIDYIAMLADCVMCQYYRKTLNGT